MENLILIAVVALFSIQTAFYSLGCQQTLTYAPQPSSGIITMEDMILSISLDNPFDKIEGIKIYDSVNELILEESGCYQKNCTYSLQGVSAGTYQVYVNVQNGTDFTGYITIS